jgi:hypothetical protein
MFTIILAVITVALVADRIRLSFLVHDLETDLDRSQGEAIFLWSCIKDKEKEICRQHELRAQQRKLG